MFYTPKENQRVALTKRLLKESLMQLLKEKELKKITVTELCGKATINRITFYRHYATPYDVLKEICWDMFDDMHTKLSAPTSVEDFARYIEDMCTYLYENSEKVLLMLSCSSDIDAFDFIKEMYAVVTEEFKNLEELRDLDTESVMLMMTYFGGGGYFLLRQWLTENIQKTPQEIARLVYRLSFSGETIAKMSTQLFETGVTTKKKV